MRQVNRSLDQRGQIAGMLGVAAPLFVLLFALIIEVGIAGYYFLVLQRTIDAAAFADYPWLAGSIEGTRAQARRIAATLAKDGTVVDGDKTQIRSVSDEWTFERDVSSRDPNWKLVGTHAPG